MDDIQKTKSTKDKRYYEKHKEKIKAKNAERNRINRLKKKQRDGDLFHYPIESSASVSNGPDSKLRVDAAVQTDSDSTVLDSFFPRSSIEMNILEDILDGRAVSQTSPLKHLPLELNTPDYKQYDNFVEIRNAVQSWSGRWGGVDNWNDSFDILFQRALQQNSYFASHDLVRLIYRHSGKGKALLSGLEELQGRLPLDPLAVHLLWQYHNELVKIVVKGITILSCRLQTIHQNLLNTVGLDYSKTLKALFNFPDTVQEGMGPEDVDVGE